MPVYNARSLIATAKMQAMRKAAAQKRAAEAARKRTSRLVKAIKGKFKPKKMHQSVLAADSNTAAEEWVTQPGPLPKNALADKYIPLPLLSHPFLSPLSGNLSKPTLAGRRHATHSCLHGRAVCT